jgi:hypothetical protein
MEYCEEAESDYESRNAAGMHAKRSESYKFDRFQNGVSNNAFELQNYKNIV